MLSRPTSAFILPVAFAAILAFTSCGSSRHVSHKDVAKEQPAPHRRLSERELKRKYASMLETSTKRITNKRLYYFIDEWWGTRYKYGGNDRNGVDCSGFSCALYKQVYEITIKRTSILQHENARRIRKVKRLDEGDLVFFRSPGNKTISHVGVYLHNNYFVHSASGKGVTIDNLKEDYWKKCFVSGGRVH